MNTLFDQMQQKRLDELASLLPPEKQREFNQILSNANITLSALIQFVQAGMDDNAQRITASEQRFDAIEAREITRLLDIIIGYN